MVLFALKYLFVNPVSWSNFGVKTKSPINDLWWMSFLFTENILLKFGHEVYDFIFFLILKFQEILTREMFATLFLFFNYFANIFICYYQFGILVCIRIREMQWGSVVETVLFSSKQKVEIRSWNFRKFWHASEHAITRQIEEKSF